jgi:ABC-type nitrate/sulfonate/bicarbonate transport system permease component
MTAKKVKIYQSRLHLAIVFLVLILPFAFFALFSYVAHLTVTSLLEDILISFFRLLLAYLIAAFIAWFCAVVFYKGRLASIVLPIFDVLQSFPTFAVLPMAIFFWGPSNFTVIFFLVITILWPIFFSIISSLKLIKHDWEEAVTICGIKGFLYFRYFVFPASIPGLITGSIIGLGEAWEALIATEIIVGIKSGLGVFFQSYSHNMQITVFGVLGFLILIFAINKLLWIPLLEWSHRKMEE